MKEYGLIGYPLSHSFSKKYFTEKFIREDIADAVFHNFSIPSILGLAEVLQQHPLLKGFSVTIPYKKQVLDFLYESTSAVKTMQACNCVCVRNEKLYGYNTDVVGFEHSFAPLLQPHHTHALILGTGGAASAVKYVLDKLHISWLNVSRNADKGNNIISYADIDEQLLAKYNVVINCTPLGTYPNVDEAPALPYEFLNASHYLFDLVYNPSETKFLSLGKEHGCIIKNGYDMLAIQAEENWKLWITEIV